MTEEELLKSQEQLFAAARARLKHEKELEAIQHTPTKPVIQNLLNPMDD
jgi:hypothetical protein